MRRPSLPGAGRRTLTLLLALLLGGGCAPPAGVGQEPAAAREAWRAGRYEDALAAYGRLAAAADAPAWVHRDRARLLAELGRWEEAESVLREVGAGEAGRDDLAGVMGRLLARRGRLEDAEAALRRAVASDASDRNVALLDLAVLLWRRGDHEEAFDVFDSFIDLYNASRERLGAEELVAVGDAVRYLGIRSPALFEDALLAYDRAAERDPGDPLPLLRTGDLFLDKYQAPDAHASFDEVLQRNPRHPGALLGKARVLDFDGDGAGAMERVRQALETSPDDPDVLTFLARLHLKLEEHDEALRSVRRALEVDPASLEALAVEAGVHYLRGDHDAYREAVERALALNPRYADVYNTVATLAADHRLYREGVRLAAEAVALDSLSWWGWGILGINQLRVGEIEEGKRNVERAFSGDPHNVWLFNTLELTDTFDRYRTLTTAHFELFLHGREADLLAPYVADVAEEAYAALRDRYRAEPPTPVRLELFPNHGDFSVRTLGLVGLGALGVSFGSVLVMDSPSAREAGEFNWASTLWHELAHAFHLAMSEHRVPRWFSEGLAVHEQRLARPHWGLRAGPSFLQAYQAGRLHPVSRLNHGFVRPEYPEQVIHSYLQASLVFEMLEGAHGLDAILRMLRGYREGRSTEELVVQVLRTTPEELDAEFDRWFRDRYRAPLAALGPGGLPDGAAVDVLESLVGRRPDQFAPRLALGQRLYQEDRLEEAERHLRAALELFPEYPGPDGPLLYLARIHRRRGELGEAAEALEAMGRLDESAYPVHVEEAEVRREIGDLAGEARALGTALEIYPYDLQAQQRLASLHGELGDTRGAVRARTAVLALEPADRAGAHYELALAHLNDGDREAARIQVLRALEIAPGYARAQELLLRLREGSP